jgi:hypothetical protein
MMSSTDEEGAKATFGPALETAMTDLTSLVYDSHVTAFLRPRQLTTHFHLDGPTGTGRAACIAMFKHLKHAGVSWDTVAICDWATRRGWATKDVILLSEFANGIQTGTRYHTDPQPWARSMTEAWLRGEPVLPRARANSPLKIKSCCVTDANPPPSRAEKIARSTSRFTRG